MVATVGVLALQGDFARHQAVLAELGCDSRMVRYPAELQGLAALIIPGGESTTISKQLDRADLRQAVAGVFNGSRFLGLMLGPVLLTPVYEANSIRGVLLVAALILVTATVILRWAKPAP